MPFPVLIVTRLSKYQVIDDSQEVDRVKNQRLDFYFGDNLTLIDLQACQECELLFPEAFQLRQRTCSDSILCLGCEVDPLTKAEDLAGNVCPGVQWLLHQLLSSFFLHEFDQCLLQSALDPCLEVLEPGFNLLTVRRYRVQECNNLTLR